MIYSIRTLTLLTLLSLVSRVVSVAAIASSSTCAGLCGNYVHGNECQCDAHCEQTGDCCSDFEQLCHAAPEHETFRRVDSCQDRCFMDLHEGRIKGDDTTHYPCECKAECYATGTCCLDFKPVCLDTLTQTIASSMPQKLNSSCKGKCLSFIPEGGCQCDSMCVETGDCCEDYHHECVAPEDVRVPHHGQIPQAPIKLKKIVSVISPQELIKGKGMGTVVKQKKKEFEAAFPEESAKKTAQSAAAQVEATKLKKVAQAKPKTHVPDTAQGTPKAYVEGTCEGRCFQFSPTDGCQCDTMCMENGDCCLDYKFVCHGNHEEKIPDNEPVLKEKMERSLLSSHRKSNVDQVSDTEYEAPADGEEDEEEQGQEQEDGEEDEEEQGQEQEDEEEEQQDEESSDGSEKEEELRSEDDTTLGLPVRYNTQFSYFNVLPPRPRSGGLEPVSLHGEGSRCISGSCEAEDRTLACSGAHTCDHGYGGSHCMCKKRLRLEDRCDLIDFNRCGAGLTCAPIDPRKRGYEAYISCTTASAFGCMCQDIAIDAPLYAGHTPPTLKTPAGGLSPSNTEESGKRGKKNVMRVTVHFGRKLADEDRVVFNDSDPYIKIRSSNGNSAQSPHINDDLDPDFNFDYITAFENDVIIYIAVWDNDVIKNHDIIGFALPFHASTIPATGWSGDLALYAGHKTLDWRGTLRVSCEWLYHPELRP